MSWCASLPLVSVPQSDQRKSVTLILPYFENPKFLRTQVGWWSTFPEHLRRHLSVIVVDDCSTEHPASEALDAMIPLNLRLFRITQKVRWNWLAARNIGAHHASDGWIVLTDMDHVLPQSTAEALIYGKHDESTVYGFSRIEHTGEQINPHSASFFMTKAMFWRIGGYDERYSGAYGSDGRYRKRLLGMAPFAVLRDRLVRHEYQGDSSTSVYKRKQPEDTALLAKIDTKVKANPKPVVLSFPYEEIQLKVAA